MRFFVPACLGILTGNIIMIFGPFVPELITYDKLVVTDVIALIIVLIVCAIAEFRRG